MGRICVKRVVDLKPGVKERWSDGRCAKWPCVFHYLNLYRQTVNSVKQQTTTTVPTTQVTEGNRDPLLSLHWLRVRERIERWCQVPRI